MFDDARLGASFEAMIRAIPAPPVALREIQSRMTLTPQATRSGLSFTQIALATAASVVVAITVLPSVSLGVVQTVEQRYAAALRALGGIAPPPAPKALISKLSSQNATLARAQARVSFTIVAPKGLPADITSSKILTTETGIYAKDTRGWQTGPAEVNFVYNRSGSRMFALRAERYDPQGEMPGKYMFEARDPGPDGRPVLVKHEQFAWRNGDQEMTITQSEDISASEIETIRVAMRGVPLPRRELHAPDRGSNFKVHVLPHF
ncbi:MAG: hypothetical protein M3126_00860 [Candidatus Eremiobacteraeota bacterium]|nr:hypothetical protein [Candidatus Eremiobacteraeota bacterium]